MKEWLKTIGGQVCAPSDITCRAQTGGRTIDFFIVDGRISHGVVSVWTVIDFASSTHYMVVIRLKTVASRALISRIVAPATFGGARPKGCERKPLPHPPTNAHGIAAITDEDQASNMFQVLILVPSERTIEQISLEY